MSEFQLFGDPSELSAEVRKRIGLPDGDNVRQWLFINAEGEQERLTKSAGPEVSIDVDRELAKSIKDVLDDGKQKYAGKAGSNPEIEKRDASEHAVETDIFSIDVPLVSQSETAGQHWSLGSGVSGIFGTRRQAVSSFGLNCDANAGEDIGVVIVDVGLNRDYVNALGDGNSYGGGWLRAFQPQPAGLFLPGEYQNPIGRMSSGHGNMIARNVLSLAPKAKLYDAAILPERVLEFRAFSRHARAILNGVQRVILNPQNNPLFPKHKHWIIVNAWAVATSFADTEQPFSYADSRTHRLNAKLLEFAAIKHVEVVFAAGNSGAFQPARFAGPYDRGHARSIWGANGLPEVHTIGAVRTDGLSIGASSQGPSRPELLSGVLGGTVNQKPDYCAPSWFSEDDDRSIINTGTSAACGMFAGYLAATIRDTGTRDSTVLKEALKATATRADNWSPQRGFGTLNSPVGPGV